MIYDDEFKKVRSRGIACWGPVCCKNHRPFGYNILNIMNIMNDIAFFDNMY